MPLSNASRLADFGTGIGTAGAIIQVDNVNQRLGVGTTAPTATLGVAGIVSATAFYGDGSNLDGVASAGLGTALSETEFDPLTVIYQTSDTLSVGATITVDPPDATTKVAYTQYAEIKLEGDADLIIADGDDFIPDILGLSTEGFSFSNTNGNGVFDTVYTDNIENAAGRGAPNFPLGITVSGISTLSGNVSIGGTLTYEDVTNVDSIGVVTARSGIDINAGGLDITAGGIDVAAGGANIVGVVTASTGINAASNLILNTGGSERLRIGTAGQIGIAGANYGTSGQVITSQGASSAPQWASPAGGMSEYDVWTISDNGTGDEWDWGIIGGTSNGSYGNNDTIITRCTTTQNPSFTKLGTGMSYSAGVWTFPSTGYWEIIANVVGNGSGATQLGMTVDYSADGGSSWRGAAGSYGAIDYKMSSGDPSVYNQIIMNTYMHIANASNQKIRYLYKNNGTGNFNGNAGNIGSCFTFKKVA